MKYLFFFVFGITILNLGCRKDIPFYTIPGEVHAWAYFKNGSYWVYVDDSSFNNSTPNYDSNYVISSTIKKLDEISASGPPEYKYEQAKINFFSSFFKTGLNVNYDATHNKEVFVGYTNSNLSNIGSNDIYILYFNINQQIESYNPKLILSNKYSTYNLNGKDYSNVVKISYKKNSNIACEFWIARNHWIIKQVFYFPDGTKSWSLLRSKIVQ